MVAMFNLVLEEGSGVVHVRFWIPLRMKNVRIMKRAHWTGITFEGDL